MKPNDKDFIAYRLWIVACLEELINSDYEKHRMISELKGLVDAIQNRGV